MSSLADIAQLYRDDPKRKGKNIKRGNKYTKEFLRFNRRYVREGQATFYAEPDKVYKPSTKTFVSKTTAKGNIKKIYKADKLVDSVVKDKRIGKEFFYPAGNEELSKNELLYDILRDNPNIRGKYRLVIKRDGDIIFDSNINIPNALSKWWNGEGRSLVQVNSALMIWNIDPQDGEERNIDFDVNFIFTKEEKISPKVIQQTFRLSNDNMCFFNPIRNWIDGKIESVESNSSKKKYNEMKNKIFGRELKSGKFKEGYIHKYKDGMPQEAIQEFCNYATIGVKIYQPFQEKPFVEVRPEKTEPRKTFTFVNTQLNHVDGVPLQSSTKNFWETVYTDEINYEVSSRQELKNMLKEANENNTPVIYNKDCYGINMIKTMEKGYKLNDEYDKVVNQFCLDHDLYNRRINGTKNPNLLSFIQQGTHFNGTIDFQELDNETSEWDGIGHIDMTAAYIQYDKCKYYDGFALDITDFRPTDNIEHNGFYLITDINSSKVSMNIRSIVNNLGWFYNDNVYTQAELKMFQDYGYTFKVLYGAFSIRSQDIKMRDWEEGKLIKTKAILGDDKKIPAYCKMIGSWARVSNSKSFFMNCDRDFALSFNQDHKNIYYNDFDDETRIETPKEKLMSSIHFASQITAFQRIIMLEQLLKLDQEKILRVCVDGIYYKEHDFDIIKPFRLKKDKMTFVNKECEHYLSNLNLPEDSTDVFELLDWNTPSKIYKRNTYLIGAGGTGKTYSLGTDKGLTNVLYVAPSWELATDAKDKFPDWDVTVKARLFNSNHIARGIYQRYSNIIIDETSMMFQNEKRHIMEHTPITKRLFWVGDMEAQLPPFRCNQMKLALEKKYGKNCIPPEYTEQMRVGGNPKTTEVIKFTKVYRFKEGDKLHDICGAMRENINFKGDALLDYLKETFPDYIKFIDEKELSATYCAQDTIIASQHQYNDKYNEMFADKEKYKVLEMGTLNGNRVYNGTILFEKPPKTIKAELRHGYTIHSFQGKTVKEGKLFIHSKLGSSKMLYTAMSRASSINQIIFIQ